MSEPQKGAEVRLESLVKAYGQVRAADSVSLTVANGEFVTLLGPSGSGKTTTLMIVAGFVVPDEGDVYIGGVKITETPAHRRGLGMVFQHYALFPHMTIFENIAYPLRVRRASKDEIRQRVQAALDLVQLPGVGTRYPRQLSGGQQQRVAVARALVYEPVVLLMDEPLGALDRKLREQMQVELRSLQQHLGITTLYVTHDQEEAMTLSDRVVVMRAGRIEQVGTPENLYERPQNQFVADFIGASNCLEGELKTEGDGLVFVAGEGLRLPVAPLPGKVNHGRVRLVIRPERIRWAEDRSTEVTVPGVVVSWTYLGERVRYLVRLQGGQTLVVTHPNLQSASRPKEGTTVWVGWNYADAIIL